MGSFQENKKKRLPADTGTHSSYKNGGSHKTEGNKRKNGLVGGTRYECPPSKKLLGIGGGKMNGKRLCMGG